MKLRLRDLRKQHHWTIDNLAEVSGLSRGYISQLENGNRRPGPDTISLLCSVFKVGASELIEDIDERSAIGSIAVPGRVGAGDEVTLVDDHTKGSGLYSIECPPQIAPNGVVAVEVSGTSMEPLFFDGDVLIYSRATHDGVPTEAIGRQVIAQTEDGRVWVKQLKVGSEPGLFHLLSFSPAGRNMLDAKVTWAAPVRLHLPKEFVKRVD